MNLLANRSPREQKPNQGPFPPVWVHGFWRRRRRRIATTALVVFGLSIAALMSEPPKYTATAMMIVSESPIERGLNHPRSVGPQGGDVDLQADILRSPAMMNRLAESLALHNDPEWNPYLSSERTASLFNFVRTATAGNAPASRNARVQESVAERVSAAIQVRRRHDTAVIEVSAASANPERAAQMANRLIELIVAFSQELRLTEREDEHPWFASRMQLLRDEIAQRQAALERYRAQLNRPSQSLCDARKAQALADLTDMQIRYDRIVRLGVSEAMVDSERMAQLRARRADIYRRQADLESRHGPLHPAVQNVRAERHDLDAQIAAEIAIQVARLRNDLEVTRARLATLEQDVTVCQRTYGDTTPRLRELEREAQAAADALETFRRNYLLLIQERRAANIALAMASAAAAPSVPSSPNLVIALLASIGVGLVSGLGAGLLAEFL
jgi:uncharacterized protein involved in exopolysaccharide biosynthesis